MAWPEKIELAGPNLDVLLAVVEMQRAHGRVSVRDVCRYVDRSPSTVHAHLTALRKDGWITWEEGKQATIRPKVVRVK